MNKELEALERIKHIYYYDENINDGETICIDLEEICKEDLDIIETELKSKEQLEKAFDTLSKENEKVMKELSKEIEKNRAFEIVKNKAVDVDYFMNCKTLEEYNDDVLASYGYDKDYAEWRMLTQEESDLLKEMLENAKK